MKFLLRIMIRCYQCLISPFLGTNCRYQPGCSAYALEAVTTHGAWRGSVLTLKRLLRCHPFAKPGYDPVPHHPITKPLQ